MVQAKVTIEEPTLTSEIEEIPIKLVATKGDKGDNGEDGFSPTVETSKTGKTTTITITDVNGEHTATILDGADGSGTGDMSKATYDKNNSGVVDDAEKVNSHTVEDDVPSGFFTGAATGSFEGTIVDLSDAISLNSIELNGDTEQQTYTGKNLFDISKVVGSTQVVNNNDGTLTINTPSGSSTSAAGQPNKLSDYCPNLKVDDIATLSFDTTGGEKYIYLYGTGANFLWGTRTDIHTKTVTQAMLDAQVLFYASGHSTTATISNFQIELGSTPTDYEPYVGGKASPSPDYPQNVNVVTGEQTIRINGKNLFSTENIATGKRLDSSGNFVNDTSYMTSDFLPVSPNTTYIYSRYENGGGSACCCEYGEGQTFILRNFWNGQINQQKKFFTFTTGENTHFIRICDFTALTKQLEFGDVSTAYTPYQDHAYTVNLGTTELCKIGTYQDYIYKSGDNWYVHKAITKIVLDGTESWSSLGTPPVFYIANPTPDFALSSNIPASNYFIGADNYNTGSIPSDTICFTGESTVNKRLYVKYQSKFADLTSFTTWLTTHNLTVYYALATATDTKITDNTLIGQLEALAAAELYTGGSMSSSGSLPAILTAEAIVNTRSGMIEAINAAGTTYTAGTGISITNGVISCTFADGDTEEY